MNLHNILSNFSRIKLSGTFAHEDYEQYDALETAHLLLRHVINNLRARATKLRNLVSRLISYTELYISRR